jgi:ABC-type polysaccharide/polyol phosphate export permease
MGPLDVIMPTPPMDEAERLRIQTTPRYRYALRVAGWTSRAVGVFATLTWIGRPPPKPSTRAPGAIAAFLVKCLVVVSAAGVFSFIVTAFGMYPSMRRAEDERSAKSS